MQKREILLLKQKTIIKAHPGMDYYLKADQFSFKPIFR